MEPQDKDRTNNKIDNLHIFITDLGLGNFPTEFILGAVLHVTEGMANMGGKYPLGAPEGAPPEPGIFYPR